MKKEKVNQLAVKNENSPSALIEMAISKNADLDKLEKLLVLKERFETTEARKAYHQAMADFKANAPKIGKDKKVSYPAGGSNVHYNHASLANVVDKISAELSKHGLSASWVTKQNGAILVTCKITHIRGHSEETTLSAPSDTSGSKNAIQAIGSTITYLERYTLLALTGLATYEMDDDGKASCEKPEIKMPLKKTEPPTAVKINETLAKLRVDLTKAQKLVGDKDFFRVLGGEGFSTIEEVNNVAVATQILRDLEQVYKDKNA